MLPEWLLRAASHFWPIPVARAAAAMGTVEVRWENGRKVLNSANANQSFGSLHQVWEETFRAMDLASAPPRTVLMLGLGGGSVVHILRKQLGLRPSITVVEVDPVMQELATAHFGIHADRYMQGDAIIAIHALKQRYDLVVVDLFNDLDMAAGVETNGFIHALRDRCEQNGRVCFNAVAYDNASAMRCDKILHQLKKVFLNVKEYTFEGVNRVFVAS